MDFEFGETEQAMSELARKILEDLATKERLEQLEADRVPFDQQLWRALADASLLGTAIPEAHGGVDLGFLALCVLLREVGRTVAPVPVYSSLVLGALPLARFGSDERKAAWLPEIAAGRRIVTAALAETDSTDPLSPTTRAERSDTGGYRLTGVKTHVANAGQASHVLVPARQNDGAIGLFFVEVDPCAPGATLSPQETSDGQPRALLELDGVSVSDDDRLGGAVEGEEVLQWLVERATAARCMMQVGVVERALEMTAQYSRDRHQFDRPIGSFQAVHQRAADAYINVEGVRLAALEAVWRLSRDLPAADHVAVAKYWASEGAGLAAYACQHLHGGIGIDVDYPLHRYFKWAIQIEHELGAGRHHLDRLGKTIASTGIPAD